MKPDGKGPDWPLSRMSRRDDVRTATGGCRELTVPRSLESRITAPDVDGADRDGGWQGYRIGMGGAPLHHRKNMPSLRHDGVLFFLLLLVAELSKAGCS